MNFPRNNPLHTGRGSGPAAAGPVILPGRCRPALPHSSRSAFTLIELLIVIAIIAVMASLIITAISNAAEDTRNVLARQQQAVVQQALNTWIARNSSGNLDLADARTAYTAAANGPARLTLIGAYLDEATLGHLTEFTDGNQVASQAMARNGLYLDFTDWPNDSYPRVNLQAVP